MWLRQKQQKRKWGPMLTWCVVFLTACYASFRQLLAIFRHILGRLDHQMGNRCHMQGIELVKTSGIHITIFPSKKGGMWRSACKWRIYILVGLQNWSSHPPFLEWQMVIGMPDVFTSSMPCMWQRLPSRWSNLPKMRGKMANSWRNDA